MSLIESLIGSATVRPDKKRILPRRRPLFQRPRDVFDLFIALGPEATIASIMQSVDLKNAEPRTLTQVVLNRWPTEDELASLPSPYHPQTHLRDMLIGQEFRASLFSRICDAYPERQRLLCIRIPRCAGEHFALMANTMHPLFPNNLAAYRRGDANRFLPALGTYARRLTPTRTLLTIQPSLAPFIQAPPSIIPNRAFTEAGLSWVAPSPPRRTGDRLFAILRDPTSLILSQVNSLIDALMQPPDADTAELAAWRTRLPGDPAASDAEGIKHIGRKILRFLPPNPMCHALADGTADGALRAARHHDIELTDLSCYHDWTKYTWDVEPDPAENTSTSHLTSGDLTPDDTASLIRQDQLFHATFIHALSRAGDLHYAVRGRDLQIEA